MEQNGDTPELVLKIRRLVEERGWNQEDFAKIADINRHTARQILLPGPQRTLRNSTIGKIAYGFGLTVSELRDQPLERLLSRVAQGTAASAADTLRSRHARATEPELQAWIERNPDRARQLTDAEFDELLAVQGPGGPFQAFGVEGLVQRIERRRKLLRQVQTIAGTEYLDLLEQLVQLLHDKVQPRRAP